MAAAAPRQATPRARRHAPSARISSAAAWREASATATTDMAREAMWYRALKLDWPSRSKDRRHVDLVALVACRGQHVHHQVDAEAWVAISR